MGALTLPSAARAPLQDYLTALLHTSEKRAGFQHPVLMQLLVKITNQEALDGREVKLFLTRNQERALADLVGNRADTIWYGPQLVSVKPLQNQLGEGPHIRPAIPSELQRAMVKETELAYPQILDHLKSRFHEIMPPEPWVPGLKHSFSDARRYSGIYWKEDGFYAGGGISLSLGQFIDWTGAVSPYFWEPSSYSSDPVIGSFNVLHWKQAVWAELARSFAILLCKYQYDLTLDPAYKSKSGTGFRAIYRSLRAEIVNQVLHRYGAVIGLIKVRKYRSKK